ncbi:MAG: glucose-6-phosphate dehydrogenase [Candidatus Paceibacterota bacterium]
MQQVSQNQPTAIVIFGGTGDLAKTKLFPALLDLYAAGQLPEEFGIIGLSRKELTDEEYQKFVSESIAEKDHEHDESVIHNFCMHIRYVAGNFGDEAAYGRIKKSLGLIDDSIGQCTNKLFYLAVPPQYYEVIFEHLHTSQALELCSGIDSWSRLLVEKPFGRDLETAQALEEKLCSLFEEEQIYRIDHYLAKDAIENILALRFVNTILADSWNGEAIESIHIKLLETKDVSNRGSFYDAIGTLRDVGQNHLLQIFSLLTMPRVDIRDPEEVRTGRASALRLLEECHPEEIVRGQYNGYAETHGVDDSSQTETYFKFNFMLADDRWDGTRFTLEAGKALIEKINEAVVTFRPSDKCSCGFSDDTHEHRNVLRIKFAPIEQMCLTMWTKASGFDFDLQEQELVLEERDASAVRSPEAYEKVLFDCIVGDQTRFVSSDEVRLAWRFITPILERFSELPLQPYEKGSAGPTDDISNT